VQLDKFTVENFIQYEKENFFVAVFVCYRMILTLREFLVSVSASGNSVASIWFNFCKRCSSESISENSWRSLFSSFHPGSGPGFIVQQGRSKNLPVVNDLIIKSIFKQPISTNNASWSQQSKHFTISTTNFANFSNECK
jgi:hypothetical protein